MAPLVASIPAITLSMLCCRSLHERLYWHGQSKGWGGEGVVTVQYKMWGVALYKGGCGYGCR